MQELKVIGVESGALLVATDAGSEFRLPVTHSLHSQLRAASPDSSPVERKAPPREVQAHIRAGKTASEVAEITGADLDYVRRFEGPVLAEREFVLSTARAVPVSVADDDEPEGSTFGPVIDGRLDSAEAIDREWTSYKDAEHGWVVHVSFTTHEIERDATWRFDPKKLSLAPLQGDAHTLSQHKEDIGPLIPRLRAVASPVDDESTRFDSGAFRIDGQPADAPADDAATDRLRPDVRSAASMAAMNRDPESHAPAHNQTADLLEALRRRRGEREAARFTDDDPRSGHPSTGTIRVIDVPLDDFTLPEGETKPTPIVVATDPETTDEPVVAGPLDDARPTSRPAARPPMPTHATPRKPRGRASMPSWDEIVFGARSDDDPA
ncbi:septation protein SepH [Frigoribacterium sp. 2-23]|uniref:septation protein SepH n=1 Tax=Frigoribacterium sp. 2-23 TaxID=3415006 RepID=UPI003C6F7FA1